MVAPQKTTIEVDIAAAEILRRAESHALAHGETLGSYLRHVLPGEVFGQRVPQAQAWREFVAGMTKLVEATVPPGHVADDSRASMYDDRD